MTAVVQRAEKAGKEVQPLIVPTNNPLFAVVQTARSLGVQELVVGASNKFGADEQLDQMALYWMNLQPGAPAPLTIRILGRDRDVYLDLAGGSRIPKISERRARSVAELRAMGAGVERVLLVHGDDRESSDLFQAVLTMLDPAIALTVLPVRPAGENGTLARDLERARQVERDVQTRTPPGVVTAVAVVDLAREGQYHLLIVGVGGETPALDAEYVVKHAPCRVFVAAPAVVPVEPEA